MMTNENPTPSAWLQQARDLIAQDRLDEAIALLRSLLENSPRLDEVLHQSGRFTAIHKQIRTGTVSHDDAMLTQNQIRAGLLALLREIETQQTESPALGAEMAQAVSVLDSKNTVVHSTITAGGDVHIGDKHVVQHAEKIYNIGHIGKADFGSLLNRSENDPAVISNNFYKINQAFIEQERNRSDDSCTPERFYVADPNVQWWGVFNDLVAPHSYYPGFKQEVEEGIYNSPYPVLAMLEGSGGMGKSTLARLLAAEMAIANQAEVWWLEAEGYGEEELQEDWEEMLRTTGGAVTLVFVDDWGKFDAPARKFMQGVFRKAPERLRFVLTGRYQEDGGLEQKYLPAERRRIFDDNAELSLDNRQLLDKVQAAVQQGAAWQSTLAALGDVTQSKPFQLLYVLFRLAEDPALKQAIKSTRATGIFRDILQYDLDRLQRSDKKGLGWALVFLAYCRTVLNIDLSKSSFLQLADHCSAPNSPLKWEVDLGDQPIKEWETLRYYCAETSSPANRRADAPRLINLSKDDLAEEILNTPFEGYKTGRDFLTRHKKSLLTYLCRHGSEYSASTLIWAIIQHEPDLFSRPEHRRLVEVQLEKRNSHHRYAVSIFYQVEWEFEDVWEMVKRFAGTAPDNLVYWGTVMAWLKRTFSNQNEVVVEKIREIQGWGIDNRQIDQALLTALPHSEKAKAAQRLIEESKVPEVICNCLSILKNQAEGIETAKRLIAKSKDHQVICNCLSILKNQPEGIQAAQRLIGESNDFQVICICLSTLKDKPEGIEAANRLIGESKVPDVICTCLSILKNRPEGIEAAKRLIGDSKDHQVICTCLSILKDEPAGKDHASEVLKKWSTETVEIVSVALRTAPLENSRPVVEAVLAAPPNEHNRLRFSILYSNFMDIPAWQWRTRGILKNWRSCHRMLVGGTLQHYTSEEDFLLPICRSIIAAGGEEMQSAKKSAWKGKPPYVGHLVTAFAHPALRREAKRKAIELLLQESKAPGFLSPYFKEILEGIALRDEFPAWGASQEIEE
jgi:hypothetical protein